MQTGLCLGICRCILPLLRFPALSEQTLTQTRTAKLQRLRAFVSTPLGRTKFQSLPGSCAGLAFMFAKQHSFVRIWDVPVGSAYTFTHHRLRFRPRAALATLPSARRAHFDAARAATCARRRLSVLPFALPQPA